MYYGISGGRIAFAEKIIIDDIHFEVRTGEKIAVVGRNGCGKTSLLRAITGEYDIEGGSVTGRSGFDIGALSQITFTDNSVTMGDELLGAFERINTLQRRIDCLQTEIEKNPTTENAAKLASLTESFRLAGGYYYQRDYESIIKSFGFSQEDKQKRLSEFSGGQRTKIAFMKLLLSKPDLLLLDEPTNHLDINAVEWLETYIKNYPNAVVLVSHDREFLDRTVSIVYEIEHGHIRKYTGNYSKFLTVKQQLYEKQLKDYNEQQREIKKINELTERFRYKATKAKMVQSKLKYLDRMDIIEPPERFDLSAFFADLTPEKESGGDVLTAENLSIGYDRVLSTMSFALKKQCKVGIIGENGLGKSTLLKTLTGEIMPLGGEYRFGVNVTKGYYDQQMAEHISENTLFDDYRESFPALTDTEIRSDLGAFLFSGDTVFKKISLLSGGERVRLALCKLFRRKPNFLLLDEPTNHMDIVGREALGEMLKNYKGSLICVSHDRYFIRQVCDCLLVFRADGTVTFFPYDYSTYAESKLHEAETPEKTKPAESPREKKQKKTSPLKEAGRLKTKIQRTEKEISDSEDELSRLNGELALPEVQCDYVRITELQELIEAKENALTELMTTWEELSSEYEELAAELPPELTARS